MKTQTESFSSQCIAMLLVWLKKKSSIWETWWWIIWSVIIDHKFTIPAVRCLVHQQRFTIERKDLDRYCLRPELEIGSGRNPPSNAQWQSPLSPSACSPPQLLCSPPCLLLCSTWTDLEDFKTDAVETKLWKHSDCLNIDKFSVYCFFHDAFIYITRNKPVLKFVHFFRSLCDADSAFGRKMCSCWKETFICQMQHCANDSWPNNKRV